jgi:DNA-binding GntR family transcriptional regulator
MVDVLRSISLVDVVANGLRQQIISGDLRPGDAVYEHTLSERYAVARPAAKAAIELLVSARLLARKANRPARVTHPTERDLDDLCRSRFMIEQIAVIHLTEQAQETPRVSPLFARIAAATVDRTDSGASVELEFHNALVRRVGSDRLSSMFSVILDETQFCLTLARNHEGEAQHAWAHEHKLICAAVDSGDSQRAQLLLRRHLAGFASSMLGRRTLPRADPR